MGTEAQNPNEHLSNVPPGAALPYPGLPVETMAANKNLKPLAPALRTLEQQLSQTFPEALAKLRDPDLDLTRAQIEIRARGGKTTSPPVQQLSDFFIIDFARSCAEELGQGGPIFVTIEPNDGRSQRFSFGFVAPQVDVNPEQAERGLRGEINELKQMIQRQQQLAMLGGSGGNVEEQEERFLRKMAMYKQIFAPAPGAEPMNPMTLMSESMKAMGSAMGESMKMVQSVSQTAQAMNPAGTAATVEAAKAQAWMGVAKEGLPLVKEAVGAIKELTAKPLAGMTDGAKQALIGVA